MRNTLFFLLVAGPLMFGAPVNNCPNTTAAASPVSNGSTTQGTMIPGAGPGNDLMSGLASGCTATDLSFSQFGNSTFTARSRRRSTALIRGQ
jgi:hypothetical protein